MFQHDDADDAFINQHVLMDIPWPEHTIEFVPSPSTLVHVPVTSIDGSLPNENDIIAKTRGKGHPFVRKPPIVVLAPKNMNIMPRKPGSSLASSSRSSKERKSTTALNPAKHRAMILASDSSPIVLAKPL
ncbi:hypothetical protein V6N13_037491 [Hibiscus sabdariffa]|uniref:Uncharacterized protein n=1 Tax=Hibiscus sabdariffa TaxID=183260 RepID=A0ABR2E989_9ROSI